MKQEWYKVLGRGMHPILMMDILITGLSQYFKKIVGIDFNHQFYKRYDGGTYFYKPEWDHLKNLLRKKAELDKNFYSWLVEKRMEVDNKGIEFSEKMRNTNFQKKSLPELKQIFRDFIKIDLDRMGPCYLPFVLDEIFEEIIKKELRTKIQEDKIDEYFVVLTTCPKETYSNKEKIKLLELAAEIRNKNLINNFLNKEIVDKIKQHSKDFIWLNQYFLTGKPYTEDEVISRLRKLVEKDTELEKIKSKSKRDENQFNSLVKELNLSEDTVKIAKVSQEHSFARDHFIGASARIYFNFYPLFNEIAKRIGLTYEDFINLKINEIFYFIDKRIELDELKKGSGILLNNGKIEVYTGKDIDKLRDEKENIEGITEIKGQIANKGYAKGRVKIFMGAYDKKEMQRGDILVSTMTTPNLSLFMEKAGAIVTEEGGLTCHAAIIAREMNKPCIIGTKIATSVFKDNDLVEVDAEKGIVRKIR